MPYGRDLSDPAPPPARKAVQAAQWRQSSTPTRAALLTDTAGRRPRSRSTAPRCSTAGSRTPTWRIWRFQPARVQLWRVVNAATDAFLNLALVDDTGNPLPLEIVARDGAPLTDDAGTSPAGDADDGISWCRRAGRLEFLVDAPAAGHKAYLVTHRRYRLRRRRVPSRQLAVVTATGAPPATPAAPRAVASAAPAPAPAPDLFSGLIARKTDRTRVIAFAEYPRAGSDDQTDFYIVERKPGAVLKPFEMGDPPAITVQAGTTEEWVVENWTHELHAFHIHQVHFRVLEVDGRKVANPDLLDVVTVPYATAGGYHSREPVVPGRVRVKLYFPASLAGDIPFHCHLVDHEDNGMMGMVRVVPKGGSTVRKAELPWGGKSLAAMLENPPICRPAAASTEDQGASPLEGEVGSAQR
jgi:FtsP/CotA-like multicopper oxidase with cupredoxin domain